LDHVAAALQEGNRKRVDRWITAVKNCLPDPKAATLLAEWAPLCIHDEKLSKRIHTGIERFLKERGDERDGEPPLVVLRYVTGHNARGTREEVVAKLNAAKLKPVGIREDFAIIGNYSAAEHGPLLIELASAWAQDPDESHMVHVLAILRFVEENAKKAPRAVRARLHNDVVELLAELFKSKIPELVERATQIRDFLGKAPFALDTLEPAPKDH
jgi:hypothetical protein